MSAWTWHGGGLAAARAHFGDGDAPWLDLSTGINPHGWPGAETAAIDWRRLPERQDLAALEAAAAAYFGVAARNVCAVPGSETGMRLTGRIIGGPAHHVAPAYRTHGEMVADAMPLPHDALRDSRDTLILANPNNPDGRSTSRDALLDLLDRRRAGAWLLLDEAFADAAPAASIADRVDDARRLVVFRSFGKFFGLAGVRLGFVLAPAPVVAALRDLLGAWPVSAAACAIGTAAYRDAGWIAAMRVRLAGDAADLEAMLARRGFRPVGACPLFRLIESDDAAALFERLARRAILTRPFADQSRWLRIGLPGDAAALARLERALADG